jgi:hypothetical protein
MFFFFLLNLFFLKGKVFLSKPHFGRLGRLDALLVAPVQRLPRYELLLQVLILQSFYKQACLNFSHFVGVFAVHSFFSRGRVFSQWRACGLEGDFFGARECNVCQCSRQRLCVVGSYFWHSQFGDCRTRAQDRHDGRRHVYIRPETASGKTVLVQ